MIIESVTESPGQLLLAVNDLVIENPEHPEDAPLVAAYYVLDLKDPRRDVVNCLRIDTNGEVQGTQSVRHPDPHLCIAMRQLVTKFSAEHTES